MSLRSFQYYHSVFPNNHSVFPNNVLCSDIPGGVKHSFPALHCYSHFFCDGCLGFFFLFSVCTQNEVGAIMKSMMYRFIISPKSLRRGFFKEITTAVHTIKANCLHVVCCPTYLVCQALTDGFLLPFSNLTPCLTQCIHLFIQEQSSAPALCWVVSDNRGHYQVALPCSLRNHLKHGLGRNLMEKGTVELTVALILYVVLS